MSTTRHVATTCCSSATTTAFEGQSRRCSHFCFFVFLAQEDQLSDILTEVRALRALVLAQGHRIDVLERQLARIEDGEV